jgi:hypothetical protein
MPEKISILIVCDGKNTEPSYFDQFKLGTLEIEKLEVIGEGYNTVSLVKRAKKLAEKKKYDQVWCVSDKDGFTAENFNRAIEMARNYGYFTAHSNQAFEYWLILHFEDHQGGGMHRDDYYDKINNYLKPYGYFYDKNSKIVTSEIFELLIGMSEDGKNTRQELASNRAKRNLKFHTGKSYTSPLNTEITANTESCTEVFKLVEEIMKYKSL